MHARAALAILALAVTDAVGAQESDTRTGYSGFVAVGASGFRTAALDGQLAANGYPTFGTGGPAVSVGAYRLFRGAVLLGGEWHYVSLGNERHQDRAIGLAGGYATLGVAYAVHPSRLLRLYPRLGLGVGGMGLWREHDEARPGVGFVEWLANPNSDPGYATLSQASMVMDLGAAAELSFRSVSLSGPVIGLRFGYVTTPFDQGWTVDGRSVTGAPRATVAGPYARLMLGWRRERHH